MQDSRVPSEYAEASVLIRGLLEPLWDITEDSERLQKTLFPKLSDRLNEIRKQLGLKNPLGAETLDMSWQQLNQIYPALVRMLGEDSLAPDWIERILSDNATGILDRIGRWSYQRVLQFVEFRRLSIIHTHVFLITWRFLHTDYVNRVNGMTDEEKKDHLKRIADPLGIANDIRQNKLETLNANRLLEPVLKQLEKYEKKRKEIQATLDSLRLQHSVFLEQMRELDENVIESILTEAENRPGRKLGIKDDFSKLVF